MEMDIRMILGVILVALVTEMVVNSLKRLWKDGGRINIILSIIIAVILCVFGGLDLMVGFGFPLSVKYLGECISGIIAALGASAVYELLEAFNEYKVISREE